MFECCSSKSFFVSTKICICYEKTFNLIFLLVFAFKKIPMFLPFRPQWVLTYHPGQFPSRGSLCGTEHWAPLHCWRLPQPHCALAERWPPAALRCPLDTASDWADHQRPEAGGQWQLRVRGHQQFWLKGGVWAAACYRCVCNDTLTWTSWKVPMLSFHGCWMDGWRQAYSQTHFFFWFEAPLVANTCVRHLMGRHSRSQTDRQSKTESVTAASTIHPQRAGVRKRLRKTEIKTRGSLKGCPDIQEVQYWHYLQLDMILRGGHKCTLCQLHKETKKARHGGRVEGRGGFATGHIMAAHSVTLTGWGVGGG